MTILFAIIFSVLWALLGTLLWHRNYSDSISLHKRAILWIASGPLVWSFMAIFGFVILIDFLFERFENWIRR